MKGARLVTLADGMRAILVPCEAESVAFGLFVASGSRHESARFGGISHFIEHMLFKGTPSRSARDITQTIEGRGGNFNAFTGEEMTCFYAHLPYEYLSDAVETLADMYLNASIPDAEFERERQVIIEEIRMYADDPDSVAQENLQRALFPESRLGAPVAGDAKTLNRLTPEDLRAYMRAHYRSDNTVAVLVGRFDTDESLRLLNATFAARRGRMRRPRTLRDDPFAGRCVPEVVARRDIHQTQLALGYRTFGVSHKLKYAVSVMDAILGRGMSSRLFQEVREKRGLSYDIASRMQFFHEAGMFAVAAGLDDDRRLKALSVVDCELDRVRDHLVGAREFVRTKDFMIGNFRLGLEKITAKLFFYGQIYFSFGRVVLPEEQVEGLHHVTREDVRAAAKAVLRREARSVSWVRPS